MNPFKEISDSFGESLGGGTWIVMTVIALILGLLTLRAMWPGIVARRESQRRFRLVANANRLTSSERRVVHSMGKLKFPEDPLLIFVSPSGFDAAATAMAVQNPELRRKLFGD
jgi:hypothetical protein